MSGIFQSTRLVIRTSTAGECILLERAQVLEPHLGLNILLYPLLAGQIGPVTKTFGDSFFLFNMGIITIIR